MCQTQSNAHVAVFQSDSIRWSLIPERFENRVTFLCLFSGHILIPTV